MISLLGIADELARLQSADGPGQTVAASPDILAVRQKLLETIVTAELEVRTTNTRIDKEIAEASNLQAYLEERRDRAIRLNTIANFISGGITGIVGGSVKLGGEDFPGDVLDTIEGGVQTGIAALAFRQQQGERRIEQGVPNMLVHLFADETDQPAVYPPLVWRYLNSAPPGAPAGQTRRRQLVAEWIGLGIIDHHRKQKTPLPERIRHVTGAARDRHAITIDLLASRSAMLTDLRVAISEMEQGLLDLMLIIRGGQR